jgi:cytochrome c oxidase cbb3-type subunit III
MLVVLAAASIAAQNRSATDFARGEQLYTRECASCHGPAGEGGRGPTLAAPGLTRAPDVESMVRVIRSGISGTDMPRSRMTEAEARDLAAFVLRFGERPVERVAGDARRGEQVYSTKGMCAACHSINGRGGAYGPDLTDIGRRRGAAHLRTSLIDPNADVPRSFSPFRSDVNLTQNFLEVHVTTKDGKQVTGVRVNEDSFTIQLRDMTGRIHSFSKSDVELRKEWGRSSMPAYGATLAPQEIEDVVAFMLTLRGPRLPAADSKSLQ